MKILVAKNAGFCKGVQNAINKALSQKDGCVTLGKLIHNEIVIEDLEKKNIHSINSLDEYKNGVLLIRSHGAGKDIYDRLEKDGIEYVDATCPFVKKIHEIVLKNYNLGRKIIIIGDKNHPEVIGTNGWCDYTADIVSCEEDVKNLDDKNEYCVVCQTTFSSIKYKNIINLIKNKVNLVVNNNTICYTTTDRQEEAQNLSKKCDLILVIGSKTSSNTTKLFEICAENCKTYLIEKISDLKSVEYKEKNVVGIVAGASTPKELIMEVKTQMSDQEIKQPTTFEEYMNSEASKKKNTMKSGKIFDVTVINATEGGITVSFGDKKDGFIDKTDVEAEGIEYIPANYPAGTKLRAKMLEKSKDSNENGTIPFSRKAIVQVEKDWEDYAEVLKQPEFKAEVKEAVKQGLKAKVGPYDVFIPSSQIKAKGFVSDPDLQKYVGKTLTLRAIKSNKDGDGDLEIRPKKPVYASAKVILEEKAAAADKALWEFFVEEKIVSGKVVRIKDFGAFVKVNGFECLAHKSNISYKKDFAIESVLEVGKTYDFIVLSVDKEKRQVSLGYKQLQKSLYEEAAEKYPVGSIITGKVKNTTNYGVYVYIEDGVDGLVPVQEISRDYVKNPSDICKVDDEVKAQVIKFDVEKNKITLSIKALLPEKSEEEIAEENALKESKRAQRMKKFENVDVAPKKKASKKGEEVESEPVSWKSEDSDLSVSFGDLLKSIVDSEEK